MKYQRVRLCTTVPHEQADAVRQALGEAGAGVVGEYRFCSFSFPGTGRFLPTDKAHPHIGKPGELSAVPEEHIDVICEASVARTVIAALKRSHPYEEPIIDITPLIEESDLPAA